MNRKNILRFAALIMAAFMCSGCGAKEVSTETGTETKTLALLLSQEDEFLTELKTNILQEAEKQGYEVKYYTADGNAEIQLAQIHEALASGTENLIVNLTTDESSEKLAEIVGDANVVLVNRAPINRSILDDNMVFVGMDESQCGTLQGEALAEYFWKKEQGTEIRYILFQGVSGLENTNERSNGALEGLLNVSFTPVAAAEFQVCNFYREDARSAMADLLKQDIEFDCIICNNDAMALGVIEALEEAGMNPADIPIVGVDHTEDGAAALQEGKLYMTVDQNAKVQAQTAVMAAINLSKGKAFDAGINQPLDSDGQVQPYTIRIPVSPVVAS